MILAFDTSTSNTSLALGTEENIWEINHTGPGMVSATLLEQADSLFAVSGTNRGDLSCLAVGGGPGSFTGLRVSFSIVRSLSMALSLPVVVINSLDAIAARYSFIPRLVVLQRARKGFAYLGVYEEGKRTGDIAYVTPEEASSVLAGPDCPSAIAGDASRDFCALPDGILLLDDSGRPPAAVILRLAYPLHRKNEHVPFEQILPDYMRRSDAEEKAGLTDE